MICFAEMDDIDEIMSFIDKEWRKDHILARDRAFFEYMYVLDDRVCFVVSKDEEKLSIDGILGFVPYDKNMKQLSLTVWKALSSANGMIGMGLLNYLIKELKPDVVSSPGINPKTTIPLYKFLKYETGKMKHFYRLSPRKEYKIALVQDDFVRECNSDKAEKIIKLSNYDDFKKFKVSYADNALKKEDWYLKKRYFEHPVYKYEVFGVVDEESKLVIIAREQLANESKCIRIVDLIGDFSLLYKSTEYFDEYMSDNAYEYIDCYFTGIDSEVFFEAGWENREERNIVIPNYFAPFEQKNIDMYYSTNPVGMVILRGDSDQDRPN